MLSMIAEYWEILFFAAQLITATGLVWLDSRTDRKVKGAVSPVEADVAALKLRVTTIEVQLADIEGDMNALPTKADLARVEGQVIGAHREAAGANHGVQRIESMLMERGMERAG
ncbi:MAG: hypothetical protein U1C74_02135 [Phenylobacterium sp.]|nr:hypothetical protein [Phenylobacterium sp.]